MWLLAWCDEGHDAWSDIIGEQRRYHPCAFVHYLSIALQHTATHGNTLKHAAMHIATIGMIVRGLCVMPLCLMPLCVMPLPHRTTQEPRYITLYHAATHEPTMGIKLKHVAYDNVRLRCA